MIYFQIKPRNAYNMCSLRIKLMDICNGALKKEPGTLTFTEKCSPARVKTEQISLTRCELTDGFEAAYVV